MVAWGVGLVLFSTPDLEFFGWVCVANFVFDQRESKVKLHKTNSSTESPSNVSTGAVGDQIIGNQTGYGTIDQYRYLLAETMNCSKNKNV